MKKGKHDHLKIFLPQQNITFIKLHHVHKHETTKTTCASATKLFEMGETAREKELMVATIFLTSLGLVRKPTQATKVLNNHFW